MFSQSIFYDPKIDLEYISDKELWKNIFLNLVPYDYGDPNSVWINLSLFIEFRECTLETSAGIENSKLISFKKSYFTASPEMKALIFITFSNFLKRFHRPFLCCYVNIPNHPSISVIEKYSPIQLCWDNPQFPYLNSIKDAFYIKLEESLYYDLYLYAFGKEYSTDDVIEETFTLYFSFACICGYILK